ncbi:MAG: NAD(P)/FAD-dependent oxidoreductase [Candidatus Helarchaeota archaeon]
MYDVIISGSGPAGSIAAETCAKNGLKTLMLEKNKLNPRFEKPCGGGIPKNTITDFGIREDNEILENKIRGHVLISRSEKKCVLKPDDPSEYWGYIVRRSVFDEFLFNRAIDTGAEVIDQAVVKDVLIKNDFVNGVRVKIAGQVKEIRANIVIAADGVGSQIVLKANLRDRWTRDQLGYCAVAFVDGYKSGIPEYQAFNQIFVTEKYAPGCYAWIFPLSGGMANVGIAMHGVKKNPSRLLNGFLRLKRVKKMFRFQRITWMSNYAVPYAGIVGKILRNGMMSVGDAAGFVSPYLGEGIYYAMHSGKFAGETCVVACEKSDFSERTLRLYRKKCRKNNFTSIFATHMSFRKAFGKNLEENYELLIDLANENEDVLDFLRTSIFSERMDFSEELFLKSTEIFKKQEITEKFAMMLH